MNRYLIITLAALIGWWFTSQPGTQAVVSPNGSFTYPGYAFSNPETFELEARVLSVKHYSSGREAELSPTDLALGWGRMMEDEVIRKIEVNQRGRWYHWRTNDYPIPHSEIAHSSANMHMIPANQAVAQALSEVEASDRIQLVGQLIDVNADDGWRWRSSRSRTDTGNGACELVLLERIVRL